MTPDPPTIPMFPEPPRVAHPSRPGMEKPIAWAKCPACTADRTALVRSGNHLVWREHDRVTFSDAKIPCPTSGVAICQVRPKVGPDPAPLCRHDSVQMAEIP